jgi:DNA-directed RNA polymerase specialized sigma24 family protein
MESWKRALADLAADRLESLKRYAFLLCGDESESEDLVQDALVRHSEGP